MVRDAFSEARGTAPVTSNASLGARGTAPAAPNAFSKARRTADSTDCGQPPWVRDAFSEAPVHETPSCRTGRGGRIFSARNGLREEASKHKKRALIKVYQGFSDPSSARTVAAACRILRRRCLFQKNVKKRETSK